MIYTAEKTYSGFGIQVTGYATEPLTRMVWKAELLTSKGELWVRSYSFQERKSKRHSWKQTAVYGSWDRRQDTLTTMPPPPLELCDLMMETLIKDLRVTWK